MDPVSIATAFVANQAGQMQLDIAQQIMKSNAAQQKAVVQILDASVQQPILPAGVGGNLDIAA